MTPERWLQLKAIFNEAVELAPEDREPRVRLVAGSDDDLAEEVLSLLQVDVEESELCNPVLSPETTDLGLSAEADAIGSIIGHYRLVEKVGQGGMGVVYRAYDEANQRFVALKILLHATPQRLHLFKKEFRVFADLNHPNLVPLYELLSDGNRWCLTMEFIEGKPFLAYIGQNMDRARDALRQLATGVTALHNAGKLHRDLKPSNLLVTPQGRVVILDFGIGSQLESDSLHHATEEQLFGTAAYLSPEQAMGRCASTASDWYGVGTILFEAITGKLPFEGPPLAILQAKTSQEAPAPKEIDPVIPGDLNDLCTRLLRMDAVGRSDGAEILKCLGVEAPHVHNIRSIYPHESTFVGRKSELRALQELYRSMQHGSPMVVHLCGRSGAGKTALARHFVNSVSATADAVVLAGRCHEQEFVPFKAFDSIIDSLVSHLRRITPLDLSRVLPRDIRILARLFPALLRVPTIDTAPVVGSIEVSAQELRRRAGLALRELIARIGDRHPLVLLIDDLHWGDADSASLLVDLLNPPDAPTFLCICCYRSEELEESAFLTTLRDLRRHASSIQDYYLTLGELGVEETEDLARKLLKLREQGSEELVNSVVAESAGRPLLIYELVEHIVELGQDAASGKVSSLSDILWRRIQALSSAGLELLKVVATAGRPIEMRLAGQAAGVIVTEPVLRSLQGARLLRRTPATIGPVVEVYHDRVRNSVLGHLGPDELHFQHLRLAETLRLDATVDAERIAFHLHQAGEHVDAAGFYAKAASAAAQALSFEQAVLLYQQAIGLRIWSSTEAARLKVQLADALNYAGRGRDAAQEYIAASEIGSDELDSLELQHRASLALLTSGHVDEGLARLRPVLRSANLWLANAPWSALASLLAHRLRLKFRGARFVERSEASIEPHILRRIDIGWSVVVGLSIIDPIRGADFQTRSLLLALKAGEPFRVTRALAVEAAHLGSSGDIKNAMRVLGEAERLSARIGRPYTSAMVELARGTIAYFDGRWQDSLEACGKAAIEFRQNCTGATWEVDTAQAFCLWSWAKMGDILELSRHSPALLKEAHERGDLYAMANVSTQIMAMVRLGGDDPDGARIKLTEAMGSWSQSGYHVQHHDALLALVPIELYSGNPNAAWERVLAEWSAFRRSLLSHIQDLRIEMLQLRAYCALAMAIQSPDRKRFVSSAAKDANRLRREKLPWTFALADYIDGVVAHLEGRDAQARAKLRSAITGFDHLNARLYAAATRMRLARLDSARAIELDSSAAAWFKKQEIKAPLRMLAAFAPGFRVQESNPSNPLETPRSDRSYAASPATD